MAVFYEIGSDRIVKVKNRIGSAGSCFTNYLIFCQICQIFLEKNEQKWNFSMKITKIFFQVLKMYQFCKFCTAICIGICKILHMLKNFLHFPPNSPTLAGSDRNPDRGIWKSDRIGSWDLRNRIGSDRGIYEIGSDRIGSDRGRSRIVQH